MYSSETGASSMTIPSGCFTMVEFQALGNKSTPGASVVAFWTRNGRFQPGDPALCLATFASMANALGSIGTLNSTLSACVELQTAPFRPSTTFVGKAMPCENFQLSK